VRDFVRYPYYSVLYKSLDVTGARLSVIHHLRFSFIASEDLALGTGQYCKVQSPVILLLRRYKRQDMGLIALVDSFIPSFLVLLIFGTSVIHFVFLHRVLRLLYSALRCYSPSYLDRRYYLASQFEQRSSPSQSPHSATLQTAARA
jgi:hypothetical protein